MRKEKPNKIVRSVSQEEYSILSIPKRLRNKIKVFVTNTHTGYFSSIEDYLTVPLAAETKGKDYFLYYLAHEFAHKGSRLHDKEFYKLFREFCPKEFQHYELDYKPRGAKLSKGVRKDEQV